MEATLREEFYIEGHTLKAHVQCGCGEIDEWYDVWPFEEVVSVLLVVMTKAYDRLRKFHEQDDI